MNIHEFIRVHGFLRAGCSFTSPIVNFSFRARKGYPNVAQLSETGTTVEQADQVEDAALSTIGW